MQIKSNINISVYYMQNLDLSISFFVILKTKEEIKKLFTNFNLTIIRLWAWVGVTPRAGSSLITQK